MDRSAGTQMAHRKLGCRADPQILRLTLLGSTRLFQRNNRPCCEKVWRLLALLRCRGVQLRLVLARVRDRRGTSISVAGACSPRAGFPAAWVI
jgi:hypothetical protein